MILYLAGPMSGLTHSNFPAFAEAARALRMRGYDVVSPHELAGPDLSLPWQVYVKKDLRALLDCDALVLLPGWEHSAGAILEQTVASSLKYKVYKWVDGEIQPI